MTFGRRTGEVFGYFVATCSLRGCWPRNWSRLLCVHLVSRTWTIRIFRFSLFYKCTKSHQRFFFNLSSFREKKLMILPNADGISSWKNDAERFKIGTLRSSNFFAWVHRRSRVCSPWNRLYIAGKCCSRGKCLCSLGRTKRHGRGCRREPSFLNYSFFFTFFLFFWFRRWIVSKL